jgi:3alpha(or 20beta)-hydroxysteroid dehydrogenase
VIETMKAGSGGSIINVSSIDGLEGSNGVAAYTSSKWGVRGFTKAACQELGQYRIRVNTLCPNPGSSEMTTPFVSEAIERLKRRSEPLHDRPVHPFARHGTIDDVVNAMVFLASDDSSFISGCDLPVDGGWTAGKIEPGAPTG